MLLLTFLFPVFLYAAEPPEILSDRMVSQLTASYASDDFGFLIFNPPMAGAFEKLNLAKWTKTGKVAIFNLEHSGNYMRINKVFGSPQKSGRSEVEDFLFQLAKRGGLMIFRADNPRLRQVVLKKVSDMVESGKYIGHDGQSYSLANVAMLVEASETDTLHGGLTVGQILDAREQTFPWQATNFFEIHLFSKKELRSIFDRFCGSAIRGL